MASLRTSLNTVRNLLTPRHLSLQATNNQLSTTPGPNSMLRRSLHQSRTSKLASPTSSTSTSSSRLSSTPHVSNGPRPTGSTASSSSTSSTGGSSSGKKPPSRHLIWYREIVPAMLPIIFLSSTIFLSLTLVRTHLSHRKSLEESTAKIQELELQLAKLRREQRIAREREKRERERILPLLVGRVLKKVGVVGHEEEMEVGAEEDERLVV
ncbi:hypothetical protein BD324DRAFT_610656 [Kockovaella imperatae]|uniref:Uncharacterized protein n=1 Tax=Kockovaella imperatae TaxID=4999 RepID=A0A1Y1U5W5_9TREE|nr:hypothetical protein BD324DRAFT_610656 [Kockovaella imperatae]ORX33382.1 hypothetical protein BD324DRAFT_610656 [Kockovaella imperatae]